MREEEEKRKAEHYALIASKVQLDAKSSNKQPEKKP
jgi:hypothetical protein